MAVQEIAAQEDEPLPENEPSPLDELTHAEMRMLYAESTEATRFAKSQQWKSVGAILIVFVGLTGFSRLVGDNALLINVAIAVSFLCSGGVIYMLALYQTWQNTEREKLRHIGAHLSSYTKSIRAIKSSREANVHRYTLLIFMIVTVVIGNALLVLFVSPLYR